MADNRDFSAVLSNKKHVAEAVSNKIKKVQGAGPSAAEIVAANEDKAQWEWVEIPDYDLFGEPHTGVSVNFISFPPGRYFVSPEMASEVKRLLQNRLRGDMRVLQPRQDVVMARIMTKSQLGAPTNSNLEGLNDK